MSDLLMKMELTHFGFLLAELTKPACRGDKIDLRLLDKIRPKVEQVIMNCCENGFEQLAKVFLFGHECTSIIVKDLKPKLVSIDLWKGLVDKARGFLDLYSKTDVRFHPPDDNGYGKGKLTEVLLHRTED